LFSRNPISKRRTSRDLSLGRRRDDEDWLAAFYVYLLASKPYGALYVVVTSDLVRRVSEHKSKAVPGFTARYGVDTLVWFEQHDSIEAAIRREKQIKQWRREWKFNLIGRANPHWIDLYQNLVP
jgi:putative endonuclease